jgi:hypothetical protein
VNTAVQKLTYSQDDVNDPDENDPSEHPADDDMDILGFGDDALAFYTQEEIASSVTVHNAGEQVQDAPLLFFSEYVPGLVPGPVSYYAS